MARIYRPTPRETRAITRRKFCFMGAGVLASGAMLGAQGRLRIRSLRRIRGGASSGSASDLTSDNFTYLGFFWGPWDVSQGTWLQAYSRAAVGWDGTSLYMARTETFGIPAARMSYPGYQPVSTFTPPVPAGISGGDLSGTEYTDGDAVAGSITDYYTDISGRNLVGGGSFPGRLQSLAWDADNSRFLFSYNVQYGTPVGALGDPSIFGFHPGVGSAFTLDGPWRATGGVNMFSSAFSGSLQATPAEWQSEYGFRTFLCSALRVSAVSFAGLNLHDFDPPAPGTPMDTPGDYGAGASDTAASLTVRSLTQFQVGVHHQNKAHWMGSTPWYTCEGGDPFNGHSMGSPDTPVLEPNLFLGREVPGNTAISCATDWWLNGVAIRTPGGKEGFLTFGQIIGPTPGANYGTSDGPHCWYVAASPGTCFHGQNILIGTTTAGNAATDEANVFALYRPSDLIASASSGANLWDLEPYETGFANAFANGSNFVPAQTATNFLNCGNQFGNAIVLHGLTGPHGGMLMLVGTNYYKWGTDPSCVYHVFEITD